MTNSGPAYSDADLDAMLDKSQYKNSDGSGNWWENMRDVVASLVGRGAGDEAILARVMPFAYEDVNVLKFIDGAGPSGTSRILMSSRAPGWARRCWRRSTRLHRRHWQNRTGGSVYAETGFPKATFHNTRLAIEAIGLKCSEDTFHSGLYIGRSERLFAKRAQCAVHGSGNGCWRSGALRVCLSDTWGLDFGERNVRDAVKACATRTGSTR